MTQFRLGLVVGKFSPLHLGHEWLINQAAYRCDKLLILSYTKPSFAHCELANRQRWLTTRYPQHQCIAIDDLWLQRKCATQAIGVRPIPDNAASDREQQEFLSWILREILHQRPDAFICGEPYGPSCADTLTAALGHAVAAVVVDRNLSPVPVTGTQIRQDPFRLRHSMSLEVAQAFVRRVVLLGGESSGKTTLAGALAAHFQTCWVPEYGRELWDEQKGVLGEPDLLTIAREQVRREDEAARIATGYLFCDTSPLTTLGYSLWMFARVDPELVRLASRSYDAAIVCRPDFPFVQDGTRRDETFRDQQHAWYLERVSSLNCPVLQVGGNLTQRVNAIASWLGSIPGPTERK